MVGVASVGGVFSFLVFRYLQFNKRISFCVLFFCVAIANFVGMMSCDLIEYKVPSSPGGTIGLFGFGLDDHNDDGSGACLPFTDETEESVFRPARVGALVSLSLALCLLGLNLVHYSFLAIPQKDVVFYVLGALQQLSLALVQVMFWNELCQTFQCTMGEGGSWVGLAHIMYLASTCINLFIETPKHEKRRRRRRGDNGFMKQEPFSITSPLTRQTSSRSL